MATWAEFADAAPEMAAVGLQQFERIGLGFLATARKDGAPRVHPVCPMIVQGRLFVTTDPTSPKRLDLQRDGRYALHLLPGENDREFLVRGRASLVTDPGTRALVTREAPRVAPQDVGVLEVKPDEWLFEYHIEVAATTFWENVGQPNTRPVSRRWPEAAPETRHGAWERPARTPQPAERARAVGWQDFAEAAPEMAALGRNQLEKFAIAFLATVRRDGAPRLHPVSPIISRGRMFVATPPTSPKRLDLGRDGRYVLRMLPGEEDEEFLVRGRASRVMDGETRIAVTEAAGHVVRPHDWIFEYPVESAATTRWENRGLPDIRAIRGRWRAP